MGVKLFRMFRSSEADRAASTTVPDVGDLLLTDEGNLYAGDGVTPAGGLHGFFKGSLAGTLLAANNLSDLNSATTARTNLGLGTVATHAVGEFEPSHGAVVLPAPTGVTATDTANLTAAITATGPRGVIIAQEGTYYIQNHFTFSNIDLIGQGGGSTSLSAATTFLCQNANTQMEFAAGGGVTGGFAIHGNQIANTPCARTGGTGANGRTFINIVVSDNKPASATNDLMTYQAAQNDLWLQCGFVRADRDIIWFDGGTGGHTFLRCEVNNSGRYHFRFDSTVDNTQYGLYSSPADITFEHCILEGSSGVSHVWMNSGYEINFNSTRFFAQVPGTGPLVDIVNGTGISFLNPLFQLHNSANANAYVSGSTTLYVRNQSTVSVLGFALWFNAQNAMVADGIQSRISNYARNAFYSCGNRYAPANGANYFQLATYQAGAITWDKQYSYEPVMASYEYNAVGLKWQMMPNGTMGWGPGGTSFTMDVSLQRRDVGALGVPNSQQVLCTGAGATTARPAASATLTGAIYVNTTTSSLDICNGSSWIPAGSGSSGGGGAPTKTVGSTVTS